jgi:phosphoglycerate dehydrogenase-like enzyme
MKKILILATSFLDELLTHPKEEGRASHMLKELAKNHTDIEIDYRCDRNPEQVLQAEELKDVVAIIADLEKYDRPLLSKVSNTKGGSLSIISRYGTGYSSVDIDAATDYGIIVTNAPGCNALPTAEWTQSTIMDVAGRRILHQATASLGKTKEGPSRLDVSGKTLGVIGTGMIGKYVVKLFAGYDLEVLAYDIYPDDEWAKNNGVHYSSLQDIYKKADIITLHASSAEMIVGKDEISLMNPTTVLVNCARGLLVDNRVVYKAVKEGRIWGYGLDEIWTESDLPLDNLNIIVSSHVGSDTDMGKIGMQIMSTEAVIDYMHHKIPKHIVNKNVLEKINSVKMEN